MSQRTGILRRLESLDIHPKLVKDFAVRTKTGATVSICAVVLSSLLFYGELKAYLAKEKVEFMEVDPLRGETLRVNFDVTFPSMPCAVVSLDAMDASGNHQLEIMHDVFKQRLDGDGYAIEEGESKHEGRGTLRTTEQLLKEKQRAIKEGRPHEPVSKAAADGYCGNCFGAGVAGQCCNTCEEVREAYRRKGWQFNLKGVEQCEKEGFAGDVTAQLEAREGCNIYGHLEVPKVAGNVHFAPGHGVQHAYAHVHDLVSFTHSAFNISHVVNSLSFGEYFPGQHFPLDGVTRTLDTGSGMQQYFVKLVPTVFVEYGYDELHSYQFSVTEHMRRIDPRTLNNENSGGLLPGVFLNYELSPMRVRVEERRNSFLHFLTRVCAIIGGVFTIMGVVDRLLEGGLEGLLRGRRAGRGKGALAGALLKD